MQRRTSVVTRASAAIASILLLGSLAGGEAKVYGSSPVRPD